VHTSIATFAFFKLSRWAYLLVMDKQTSRQI